MNNLKQFFANNSNCNLDIPDFDQFSRFNDVEVSPVFVFRNEETGMIDVERTDKTEMLKNPQFEVMYSVYLSHDQFHPANQGFGGSKCVGDFPLEAVAIGFVGFMRGLMAAEECGRADAKNKEKQFEQHDFETWATPLFPGMSTNGDLYQKALAEWSIEKRIRALEAQGASRSDAQGIVEAEDLSK